MTKSIPIRLNKEPLIEAVWELRFRPKESSIGEPLFGVIYKKLSDRCPKVVRLPGADIPSFVREQEPPLRYLPRIRMVGDNLTIQIGDFAVSLSNRRPYRGWQKFSAEIKDLLKVLRESELILYGERISLKYVDLLELDDPPTLNRLNLQIKIREEKVQTRPVRLWTKIEDGEEIAHIVEIFSPAEVRWPGEDVVHRGVLVDIDSVKRLQENETWANQVEAFLNPLHEASKQTFFGLLTPETIEALEPIYQE